MSGNCDGCVNFRESRPRRTHVRALECPPMAADELIVHGAREHNLKDVTVRLPRNALVVHHRPLRLRQVVARVRHDLRRGPAPLRRVALRLRAPVPADDGEARRRLDRRASRRRSRSTRRRPRATRARRSARSPRSTTTCACSTRASAGRTARLRAADRRAVGSSRSSTRCWRCPRARGSRSTRRSCATARASSGTCSRSCAARASRASRSTASTRLLEEEIVLDKKFKHDDRGRRRPAGDEGRPAPAADRTRSRPRCARPRGSSTIDVVDGESHALLREVRLPRARRLAARARSRASSRSTRRTAPARAAPASARSSRSTPTCSCPTRRSRSPTARSCRGSVGELELLRVGASRRSPTATRSTLDDALGRAHRREQQDLFLHGTGGERVYVTYQNRMGRKRSYMMAFEGIVASLQRRYRETDSSHAARADRGVHVAAALPGLQRRAAASPRCSRSRSASRNIHDVHAAVGDARRSRSSTSSS